MKELETIMQYCIDKQKGCKYEIAKLETQIKTQHATFEAYEDMQWKIEKMISDRKEPSNDL